MIGAVVVQYDERGDVSFHVYGDERVRLFIIDERCKGDRVYEWLNREPPEALKTMIGDSPIGSSQDDRHAAIENRILKLIDGKPHLEVVE